MLMCPYQDNETDQPFLTVVFLFILTTIYRFMNIYPLCGETPVEKVFPSNGGLVFDQVAVVLGEFTWINRWGWSVLKTE